jgi:UDP-N-acetylmuramate-alanine ligase
MVDLKNLNLTKLSGLNIHFIGIEWSRHERYCSALCWLDELRFRVLTKNESQMTKALKALGAKVQIGHDAENIEVHSCSRGLCSNLKK